MPLEEQSPKGGALGRAVAGWAPEPECREHSASNGLSADAGARSTHGFRWPLWLIEVRNHDQADRIRPSVRKHRVAVMDAPMLLPAPHKLPANLDAPGHRAW
jgi:hypothetical protein